MEKVQFSANIPEGKTAKDLLGKPVRDPDGKVIGKVVSVSDEIRTGNVMVTVEVEDELDADRAIAKATESLNQSMGSAGTGETKEKK